MDRLLSWQLNGIGNNGDTSFMISVINNQVALEFWQSEFPILILSIDIYLFHHEIVLYSRNLPQHSKRFARRRDNSYIHHLLSATDDLQLHVAQTQANRNLRPL
jgi:hypothetical protein